VRGVGDLVCSKLLRLGFARGLVVGCLARSHDVEVVVSRLMERSNVSRWPADEVVVMGASRLVSEVVEGKEVVSLACRRNACDCA
jgi:hypothetical protein